MENRAMTSGPTIIQTTTWEEHHEMTVVNEQQFELLLATLLPEVFTIWKSLEVYKINAAVIPPIIKALGDIVYSSKLGEVIVEIRPDQKTGAAMIRRVRSVDTRHLDLDAIDKNG